jgi:hypothetical protein
MPATDYTDPEIPFPRLQVRIQKLESDTYHLTIWLWERAGDDRNRRRIMNQKWSGSYPGAREHGADVSPDDITVESLPKSN